VVFNEPEGPVVTPEGDPDDVDGVFPLAEGDDEVEVDEKELIENGDGVLCCGSCCCC